MRRASIHRDGYRGAGGGAERGAPTQVVEVLRSSGRGAGVGSYSEDDMSDDTRGYRGHEKVDRDREELLRRALQELSQGLWEMPTSGAEPSEGEEVWLDAAGAQQPAEKRRSWWSRLFGP